MSNQIVLDLSLLKLKAMLVSPLISLEKKLAENNAQWEIIKNGKKSKRNSIK